MADIRDLYNLSGLRKRLGLGGGTGSIHDVAAARKKALELLMASPEVAQDQWHADAVRSFHGLPSASRLQALLADADKRMEAVLHPDPRFNNYKFPEGDMQPTEKDYQYYQSHEPQVFERPDEPNDARSAWLDHFAADTLHPNHDVPGHIPLPQPRKPWLIPYGDFANERSDARGQELPPGVGVRPSDAYQIQKDLTESGEAEDEDLMNHILENIGKH